jgi:mannose-6-phosphate isomerase-like protein (cupin superfamily)
MSFPRPSSADSYPPDTYEGDAGEASAWIRPADAPAEVAYENGVRCDYLLRGPQSSGYLGIYRWTFGDTVTGPDAHFHRSIAELFYVLDGEVRLYDGRTWVDAGAGDFFYVPEGGLHGFKGGGGASMLLMFTPGAPREDYFETLAALGRGATMTPEERAAFMLRHDTHWVD